MKVIFLDIDGVLNSIAFDRERTNEQGNIDETRLPLLKQILDETGALIVLSSSWRKRWDKEPSLCDNLGAEINSIGIIAQQLQMVAPELVTEELDGHLSIKTTKFIFYVIKAIQELSGDGYEKAVWDDPYSLLEKKTFCAKLNDGNTPKQPQEIKPKEIKIPIRK